MNKAYRVKVDGYADEYESIVLSKSPQQARYASYRSAQDAGYDMPFISFRSTRAPEYDYLCEPLPCSRSMHTNFPYAIEYVDKPCGCTKCTQSNYPPTENEGSEL